MSFEPTRSRSSTERIRSAATLAGSLLVGGIAPVSAQLDFDLPRFGDWSADTVVLDAPALDGAGAGCPIETPDGLVLYTARRDASGAFSSLDIWLNMRPGVDQPFEAAVQLPAPANALDHADFCPTPIPGGNLLFVSGRPGGCGGAADIYFVEFDPVDGWLEPENLGCFPFGPNTPGLEFSPALVAGWRGFSLFYSTDFFAGNQDIRVSKLGPGNFRGSQPVTELNTPFDDRQPNLSRDGLEIVFASDRHNPGSGDFDIYHARRNRVDLPFSEPVNLSQTVPFSTAGQAETRPSISRDGRRLVWGSGGIIHESQRQVDDDCFRFVLQPTCD